MKKITLELTRYEADTLYLLLSTHWHGKWRLSTISRIASKLFRSKLGRREWKPWQKKRRAESGRP